MSTTLAMIPVLVLLLGGAGLAVRRRLDATVGANPPSPGNSSPARLLLVPVAVLGVVVAFAVVPHAGADTAPSNISMVQTPAAGATQCEAAGTAATATIDSNSATWTVMITATTPICDPVTAVVYAMPNNVFWPWPQQKLESKTFTVGPGVTTIMFTKGCGTTQFDVVTGPTPDSIQPVTGPMHGPLLFLAPYTGVMNWETPCPTTTTTIPPTTSTTSTSTSTSTTTSTSTSTTSTTSTSTTSTTVAPTSTVAPTTTTSRPAVAVLGATVNASTSTTTPTPVGVLGETVSRTAPTAAVAGLATTGTSVQPMLIIGLVLLAAGAAVMVAEGRRRS